MKKIFSIILLIFPIVSCYGLRREEPSEVVLLLYMCADNDLREEAVHSLTVLGNLIKEVDDHFKCIAFVDGTMNPYQEKQRSNDAAIYQLETEGMRLTHNLGELDSCSLETFKHFIDKYCPIGGRNTKYIISFWGHAAVLVPSKGSSRTEILSDESSKSNFSLENFASCIQYLSDKIGKKVDIVGIDACSAMHLELACKIADHASFLAGSQINQKGLSWPYEDMAGYINSSLYVSSEDILHNLIKDFAFFYTHNIKEYKIIGEGTRTVNSSEDKNDTLSVVRLSEAVGIKDKFMEVVRALTSITEFTLNEDLKNSIFRAFKTPSKSSLINKFSPIDFGFLVEGMRKSLQDESLVENGIFTDEIKKLSEIEEKLKIGNSSLIFDNYSRLPNLKTSGINLSFATEEDDWKNFLTYFP